MNESLTIALVSTQRLWQGGEEQARQLAVGLRKRGHQCVIIAMRDRPFAVQMEAQGFRVITLPTKLPTPWRIVKLRRALRDLSVDVVHFNDAHAVTVAGLAAWRLPGIVTVAARRAAFPMRSPTRYRWFCDHLFCVSQFAATVCAQAGIPNDRLRVVHDGVDPDRVGSGNRQRGREMLALSDHEPMLLTIGSLVDCKGHRFLIDAMPHVLERFPDACLVLAGDGDLAQNLRQQAKRLNVRARVRFLGFRSDIPDLIHACDLFVFPSIQEGFGSTLVDVMLAQRPIVTTTAGGIPDVVGTGSDRQQKLAWIVSPGNAADLSRTLVEALGSPQENAALVERAKRKAQENFTVDHMVEATLDGYREALARKRH